MPKTYKGIPINEHCRPTFLMDTDTKSLITFYQNTSIQQHMYDIFKNYCTPTVSFELHNNCTK